MNSLISFSKVISSFFNNTSKFFLIIITFPILVLTLTYSKSGWIAIAKFEGIVHGVVVQISSSSSFSKILALVILKVR